jgi:two-component system sensor histidine kinase TctE
VAYDRSLLASTRALAERVSIVDGKVVADVPYVALDSFETDTLGRIYYKVTGIAGETVSGYADLPPVPANVPRSEAYPALVRFTTPTTTASRCASPRCCSRCMTIPCAASP